MPCAVVNGIEVCSKFVKDRSDMHAMLIQWSFLKFTGLFQATVKYIEDF